MRERSTDDLGQELMGAPNIDAYIHNNEAFFSEQSITESLAELYERKAVSKAAADQQSSSIFLIHSCVISGQKPLIRSEKPTDIWNADLSAMGMTGKHQFNGILFI